MFKRLTAITMAALLASLTFSAVSDASPVQALQATPPPLERLLTTRVPDNAVGRTVIWYSSQADLERVLNLKIASTEDIQKLPQQQQAAYLLEFGRQVYFSAFSGADQAANWGRTFGIDAFAVEREVSFGASPAWAAVLEGSFQSGSIASALQKLGYKPSQVAGQPLYSLGEDNATNPSAMVQKLIKSSYNRLVVTDKFILAAPATAYVQAMLDNSKRLGADPAILALVRTLEGTSTIPNTQLLSAALFDGPYLADKFITADPVAAVGEKLPGSQVNRVRSLLQKEPLLPRYQAAGIAYRRGTDAKSRYLVLALVYTDANAANRASATLADRLPRYTSLLEPDRTVFDGWKIDAKVTPTTDNKLQVVTVILQFTSQTDLAWVELVQDKDIAFLAAER